MKTWEKALGVTLVLAVAFYGYNQNWGGWVFALVFFAGYLLGLGEKFRDVRKSNSGPQRDLRQMQMDRPRP